MVKKIFSYIFYPITALCKLISDKIYDLRVVINSKRKGHKIALQSKQKIKDIIFYWSLMIVPIIMLIISKVVINGSAILLSFQKYTDEGTIVWAGLENFQELFGKFILTPYFGELLLRSFSLYLLSTAIGLFIATWFTFYVYKKKFGHKFFKVILFIPTILSSIITVYMFKTLANEVLPEIISSITGNKVEPLITNPHTAFPTILTYTLFMGMGGGLLTGLATMNSVDPSIIESAQLDGIGFFKEYWLIVWPQTYKVATIGLLVNIAGIFTTDMGLYAFFGNGAPPDTQTIGYYFMSSTLQASEARYPYLSSWGLVVTGIVTPLTLYVRHLINKYGPSEE